MKEVTEFPHPIQSPVAHKTLALEGYDIHYFVSGEQNQDLIVFLHPAFSDHTAFQLQIDFFSEKYRVISIDLIGHGLSKSKKSKDKIDASSSHIEQILEIEGFNSAHLVGVSMGSLMAQYFALKHPNKTKSLTALGGYSINTLNKEVAKAQRASNLGLILRALFSMNSFRKEVAEKTCSTQIGKALFYASASNYERKSFRVMQGLQHVMKERKNSKPPYSTLILTGEHDIALAQKIAKDWLERRENSEYQLIPNAGHCANLDQPLAFNNTVREFIDSRN